MRSLLAALFSLTLPTGQTTGQRIVLDGVNGLIDIFDTANILRIELGQTDGIRLFTGDPSENVSGHINAVIVGAGASRRLALLLDSPQFFGLSFPTVLLESKSLDSSIPTKIQYVAAVHDFVDAGDGGPDIKLQNRTLPRGLVDRATRTANISLSTVIGTYTTIMTGTAFTAVTGRRYKLTFYGGDNMLIAAGAVGEEFREKFQVSVNAGAFADVTGPSYLERNEAAAATRQPIPTKLDEYVAVANDSLQFRYQAAHTGGTAGLASSLDVGPTPTPLVLLVEDIGI